MTWPTQVSTVLMGGSDNLDMGGGGDVGSRCCRCESTSRPGLAQSWAIPGALDGGSGGRALVVVVVDVVELERKIM